MALSLDEGVVEYMVTTEIVGDYIQVRMFVPDEEQQTDYLWEINVDAAKNDPSLFSKAAARRFCGVRGGLGMNDETRDWVADHINYDILKPSAPPSPAPKE